MGRGLSIIKDFHPKYGYLMIKKLKDLFGLQFLLLSTAMFFTQNGMMGDLSNNIQSPYYSVAGVEVRDRAEMGIIAYAPSNLKSVIGLITDILPIGGRRKFYYVFAYVILGIVAVSLLAILPLSVVNNNPLIGAMLFFCMNWTSASADVLFEAKNIELMQKNPIIKSDLLSFCWFLDTLGQLFPNLVVGFITQYWDVRGAFIIFLPFFFTPLPLLLMGSLIQDKANTQKVFSFDLDVLRPQWKLVLVSFFQFAVSIGNMFFTYYFDDTIQMIYGITTGIAILIAAYIFLDLIVANWFCFLVLNATFYIDIEDAMYYFYVNTNCVEGGPLLSYVTLNSIASTINNIIQFIAIFCFQVLFYDWKFRNVFCLIILIRIASIFFDIFIIYRWSESIGIPDEFFFLFGHATVGMMAFRVMLYVNSYMNAKLCPKYFEATMYSLLVSAGYVGVTAAKFIGIYMMSAFGIDSSEKGCNFDNLGTLALISNLLVPLLSIPCIYILIPNTRMNEIIIKDQLPQDQQTEFAKTIKDSEIIIS